MSPDMAENEWSLDEIEWVVYCEEAEKKKKTRCAKKQRRKRCPFDWWGKIRTHVFIGELP